MITNKKTTKEVKINFRNYGEITIPKGTRVTNKTACGIDEKYNFVDDFSFINSETFPDTWRLIRHDATFYGIDIPSEYVG